MNRIVLATLIAFLTGAARSAPAQGPVGVLRGRILDSSRVSSAVVGIPVALRGTPYRTATDSTGRFLFSDLPATTYTLIASPAPPHRPVLRRNVTIVANRITELALDLTDASVTLEPVVVTAARPLHVIGHLPDVRDNVIYNGKKTEVIVLDSLQANLAQDVERQILGRIPGAHFSETAAAGFPSNGVGFRGLDPTQSVEVNTRQNGVNIAADLYGYPETYYSPPAEALDRIEVVRGAGSLAFGPQFGGSINYVVRQGGFDRKPAFTSEVTTGSFGLVNAFNAVAGGTRRAAYYAFVHYRGQDGWRPNSDFRQLTAYGSATYQASPRLTLGLDYTFFRNRIHMPGGLSDAEFTTDPSQSFRARNWLANPWNTASARASYQFSPTATWETTLSFLAGDRHLVWRNEDGGPGAADAIDPATGTFVPREVERETFHNGTIESRFRLDTPVFGRPSTLAVGVRLGANRMRRFEGGPGSTGSDFDMNLYGGTWERALRFTTTHAAAFAEGLLRVNDRLSLTPGVRFEYLRSGASGYTELDSSFTPRSTAYPLVGVGAEYVTTGSTALYASIAQAYRPILYASLTPFGSLVRVDPSLHSSRGFNADLGWRGTLGNVLKLDVSAFYLHYGDRIGTRTVNDGAGGSFSETANIGNSTHRGVESYLEFDPLQLLGGSSAVGSIDLFSSFAYVDARYASGRFAGNRVEQAPRVVDRAGLSYARGRFAFTLQRSHTSMSFGDANNSNTPSDAAEAGVIPAYTVFDWSGQIGVGRRTQFAFGVNNLTNARYFTKRTGEYPGPGILPGIRRSFYAGVAVAY